MSSADLDRIEDMPNPPPVPGQAPVPPPIDGEPPVGSRSLPPPMAGEETIAPQSGPPPVAGPADAESPSLTHLLDSHFDVPATIPAPPVAQPPTADPMTGVVPSVLYVKTTEDDDEDENENQLLTTARASPPWMVSMLVHAMIVIVLAMIPLLIANSNEVVLDVALTEQHGDQPQLETFADTDLWIPEEVRDAPLEDIEPVEDPYLEALAIPVASEDVLDIAELPAPAIGAMLSGREAGMKEILLATYGGSPGTEAAVLGGLKWLHTHQDRDGLWSLSGTRTRTKKASYPNGGGQENKPAATAMAMLAFQGFGQTHQGGPRREFEIAMRKAVAGLLRHQDSDGSFHGASSHHWFYTQALCALAICELYAMTEDPKLRSPAQRSVNYLVEHQASQGGWKYNPGTGSDLSVTGWVMMALQSARMGGLEVPQPALDRTRQFLDSVSFNGGDRYRYERSNSPSLPMTAEGLLCRQYLGWRRDNSDLVSGADWIVANPIAKRGGEDNFYYLYYATQVLHNMEGEYWHKWNATMAKELPARQDRSGAMRGSWDPKHDRFGGAGGRLYTTCLAIYMLEVYYRHMPIYSVDVGSQKP